MLCCGDSGKKVQNTDDLLAQLRKPDEDVKVNLNECQMTFLSKSGQWLSKKNILII